ncbi:MAG: 1-acyl-sn-glycerol-3-phosphate acyltransferase [Actinobacteria bacterium]|nr:1-acyl-sn-glycerol-3-phosphate acyltransferase [Actinomycetota bacterium]
MDRIPATPSWLQAVSRAPVRWWLRLDVEDVGRLPASGPVIVASHHRSHLDSVVLGATAQRRLTFLGSAHLAAPPVIGSLLQWGGMMQVQRGSGETDVLERCVEVLDRGGALVIFPEGGRSRDGQVYRPRSGVARIASAAGCPVVPVGINGTAEAWPVDRFPRLLTRHDVRVAFGEPLDAPEDDPAERSRFADRLHDALVELSDAPRADGLNLGTSA